MRLRLLRRRLTISAPRMAVRSAVPWPLRWLLVAVLLGFSAAVALWAFEFGKSLAGLDARSKEELVQLRAEVVKLREERDKAQSVANTADSLLTTERVALERVAQQVKQLEAENRALRDDLGFFERLLPAGAAEGIVIRGLHVEPSGDPKLGSQLRWQVLLLQTGRNVNEFQGKLELTFSGTLNGQPWSASLPDGAVALQLRQYRRLEGVLTLPPSAVVKTVSAKVVDGAVTRATQSIKL